MPRLRDQVCWLQLRFMSALTEGADSASMAAPASQQDLSKSSEDRGADAEGSRNGLQSQLQTSQRQQQQQLFQAGQQQPRDSRRPEQKASQSEAQESTPSKMPGTEASDAGNASQTGSDRREQETVGPAGLDAQFRDPGIRAKAAATPSTTAGEAQVPAVFQANMPFSDEPPLADSLPTQGSQYLPDRDVSPDAPGSSPAQNGYQHEDPWASSLRSAQTSARGMDSFQIPPDLPDSAFVAAQQDSQGNSGSYGYPLNGDSLSGYPSGETSSARRQTTTENANGQSVRSASDTGSESGLRPGSELQSDEYEQTRAQQEAPGGSAQSIREGKRLLAEGRAQRRDGAEWGQADRTLAGACAAFQAAAQASPDQAPILVGTDSCLLQS